MTFLKSDNPNRTRSQQTPHPRDRAKLGISSDDLLPYGQTTAKVIRRSSSTLVQAADVKLIWFTAINPHPRG